MGSYFQLPWTDLVKHSSIYQCLCNLSLHFFFFFFFFCFFLFCLFVCFFFFLSTTSVGLVIIHQEKCPYNIYPFLPHFYIEKLGFAGVYPIFLIFAPKTQIAGTR